MESEKEIAKDNPPPYPDYPLPSKPSADMAEPVVVEYPTSVVPVLVVNPMGPKPTDYVCPSCHAEITTRIKRIRTTRTHLYALLLCIIGGVFCMLIPYCMDSCHNLDHYCPNCDAYIGQYVKQ